MTAGATVLFDAPGPRARRLYAVIGVIGFILLLLLLWLVYRGFSQPENDQFTAEKWLPFLDPESWTAYLHPRHHRHFARRRHRRGALRHSGHPARHGPAVRVRGARVVCGVFVEFFRAVPVLMMMLFAYFVGLYALSISGEALSLFGVVAGLTFYNSSVIAELIRSGVGSLPRGQREAGLAIGLTPTQTLTSILLPQAITAMLPSIISQLVVIAQGLRPGLHHHLPGADPCRAELLHQHGNLIPTLIVVAAIFIVINYALTRLARFIERRLQASRRGPRQPIDPMMNPALATGAGVAATVPTTSAGTGGGGGSSNT